MPILSYLGIYLAAVNLVGFVFFAIDKSKARRGAWRIPESTLFLFAIFGGSIGCIFGMQLFRHKTQKPAFYIGLPVILIIQILVALFLWLSPSLSFRVM